jgi:uncharacterized protein (DUF305 family)
MKMLAVVALILAVLIASGTGPAGAASSTTRTASKPSTTAAPANPAVAALSKLSGKDFDVAFMRALIPVHEEAIEIAMAATLNANHPELLQWNQVMIDRKSAQVRQMLGWLQDAGATPAARGAGVVTDRVKKMRSLTGDALEREYLPMITKHLEQSTALAALAATKASRADIKAWAQSLVKVERGEAEMLRGWQKRWYGK